MIPFPTVAKTFMKNKVNKITVAEGALFEREEFLSQIIENIPNMIFIKDAKELRFVQFNKAGEKLLGYKREDLIGKNDYDFFSKEQADFFTAKDRHVLDSGELYQISEEPIDTKNGRRILSTKKIPLLDKDGKPAYLLGISEDITEMRAIEARLRQSEKMEAIGRLAGGIAHDFNNLLGGIIGYTQMSLEKVDKNSILDKNLRKILTASERAKHLVKQILTFSRQSNQEKSVVDVQPIIMEVLELLKASVPAMVALEFDGHKDVKPVLADATKIHEMILNLAANALYAMDNKGTLTVRLFSVILDKEVNGLNRAIAPGEYTVIEVIDTGSGMDDRTLEKVFDPFFTTKPVDKGTGMGLSVVIGVVHAHEGDLQVESEQGKGSTFRIFLPVAKKK
jgi:PAS domain S-box-containing protein